MGAAEIIDRFSRLGVWERAGQRAPHKPLLLLIALGRWAVGDRSDIPYAAVDRELSPLLKEFGLPGGRIQTEYPFWWLQTDGVWIVRADRPMTPRKRKSNPPKRELLDAHARGGFTDDVKAALDADPGLASRLAAGLLDAHFPASLHADILAALGLASFTAGWRRQRDRSFRERVLGAYDHRCAVCGLDLRLGGVVIAVEAAHVRWHQAGGPDREDNGLALCVLHNKLFDLGAWTTAADGTVLVSVQASGTTGFVEVLSGFHQARLRPPRQPQWRPAGDNLAWHRKQVFKGGA